MRPYLITLNCSAIPRPVLGALAEAAWGSISAGRRLGTPTRRQIRVEVYNSPRHLLHGTYFFNRDMIRIFLPRSYREANRVNELTPRTYPGLTNGPEIHLHDLEECAIYLLAHEFSHSFSMATYYVADSFEVTQTKEMVCELSAERALQEFRLLRNFWLPRKRR